MRDESVGRESTLAIQDKLAALVQKGVKLLDQKVPNWREAFRAFPREQLRLADCRYCVLGQLSNAIVKMELRVELPRNICLADYPKAGRPGWALGIELLGFVPGRKALWQYGFDRGGIPGSTYGILQSLWEEEIYGPKQEVVSGRV